MRSLPSLVHGAGSSSSRFSRYLQTKKPDLPFSGQYFTTLRKAEKPHWTLNTPHQSPGSEASLASIPYLVDSIVAISFLGSVFTVLSPLAAANNPDRFAILPVLCFCTNFVVDGNITIQSQGAMKTQNLQVLVHALNCYARSWQRFSSFQVIPIHVSECLITWLLSCPFVARKISTPWTSVSEFIAVILKTQV